MNHRRSAYRSSRARRRRWLALLFGFGLVALVELGLRLSGVNRAYLEHLAEQRAHPLKFAAVMARHRYVDLESPKQYSRLTVFPGEQEQDPDLFWILKPGSRYHPELLPTAGRSRRSTGRARASEQINSLGWRDDEPPATRKEGELRVFCLGDSSTFGLGVYRAETYADQLERLLSARFPGRRCLVFNTGAPGYTSYQGLQMLRLKVLPLGPDVVTIFFGINDSSAKRNISDAEFARLLRPGPFGKVKNFLLERFHIYTLLHRAILRYKATRAADEPPKPRVSFEEYRENIRTMVSLTREAGALPILIQQAFRSRGSTAEILALPELAEELEVPLVRMPRPVHAAPGRRPAGSGPAGRPSGRRSGPVGGPRFGSHAAPGRRERT